MYGKKRLALCLASAICSLVVVWPSCEEKCIMPARVSLRPGDLVLRRGVGLMSRVVLEADKGGYSHIGMVVDSCGCLMVVHAVPGEPDSKSDVDRVKMEPVERYYMSTRASGGLVLRYGDRAVAGRAAEAAVRLYRRGTLFDHDYDDRDTTRMYCCELVEFAYTEAGRPLTRGRRHDYTLPGISFEHLILPSDFTQSGVLVPVAEF